MSKKISLGFLEVWRCKEVKKINSELRLLGLDEYYLRIASVRWRVRSHATIPTIVMPYRLNFWPEISDLFRYGGEYGGVRSYRLSFQF